MRVALQFTTVLIILSLASVVSAQAMTFNAARVDDGLVLVLAEGEINPGDSDRLVSVLVTLPAKEAHVLALNSPGGNVVASQSLAATIKQAGLGVYVAKDATCASACFLLYAAGRTKFYMPGARIGVHSATIAAYETPGSMAMTTVAARAMSEMGVPDAIVGRMIRTPPGSIAWLSEPDLASMGALNLDRVVSSSSPAADPTPLPPIYRSPSPRGAAVALAQPVLPVQPARPSGEAADPTSGSFQHGASDRARWEGWFKSLTGDYRAGADFWTSERSKPRPASCNSSTPETVSGCLEAKRLLTGVDAARKTDRQYWWGWNSYAVPTPISTPAPAPTPNEACRLGDMDACRLVWSQPPVSRP